MATTKLGDIANMLGDRQNQDEPELSDPGTGLGQRAGPPGTAASLRPALRGGHCLAGALLPGLSSHSSPSIGILRPGQKHPRPSETRQQASLPLTRLAAPWAQPARNKPTQLPSPQMGRMEKESKAIIICSPHDHVPGEAKRIRSKNDENWERRVRAPSENHGLPDTNEAPSDKAQSDSIGFSVCQGR